MSTFLLNVYSKWRSDGRLRTGAMPHIKSYCRFSSNFTRASWFVLTSANLSKAAWGMRTKNQSMMIQSYEAGVLFLPKFMVSVSSFAKISLLIYLFCFAIII